MKPESGLESRTTSLGEAPGISSFAMRPSSPVSQQGKTRHLLPTTHSMAGSGVIVGPGRMVHACTTLIPTPSECLLVLKLCVPHSVTS